jgi:lactase-phlorizin hydrolase
MCLTDTGVRLHKFHCIYKSVSFLYRSGSSWLKVTPWGLRKALNWVRNHYGNVPIYITENGVSDKNGSLQDDQVGRHVYPWTVVSVS